MIISMQERDSKDDIEIKVCDVGIVGIALDDRGKLLLIILGLSLKTFWKWNIFRMITRLKLMAIRCTLMM